MLFKAKKNGRMNVKVFVTVIAFMVIMMFCIYGADSLSKENLAMQKQTLEDALHSSTIQYYALEGYYPESLNSLLSSSSIHYDESRFYIDYQPVASNIMPDITVISRK